MRRSWTEAAAGRDATKALPQGWGQTRVADISRIINGAPYDSKYFGDLGEPLLRIRDLATQQVETRYDGPELTEYRVTGDSLLVGMDGDFNVGRWTLEEPALLNQRVLAIEADPLWSKWIEYCLPPALKVINDLTYATTVKHLSSVDVAKIRIPNPPSELLRAIADYLDHETAEIDQLITGLDSLQVLSTERVEARIIKTIQTGGRSTEGLADTGIPEWPQAPISWRHTRLKSTIRDARNGAWGEDPETGGEIRRCIRVADFSKSSASIHDNAVTSRSYARPQVGDLSLKTGDLIIEKSGGGPTTPVGNVVLYSGPGGDMYSNFVARIRLAEGIDATYAAWLHRSLYLNQVTHRSIKQTTGIQNLDADSYFNESIFVPPYEEQHRIGNFVSKMVESQDELRSEIRESIDLARERRAALITAAITGQIDVTARNKPAAEQLEDDIAQGLHREN